MLSVLYEVGFGVLLFVAALFLIPKLLSGDKKVYEMAVPFGGILLLSVVLINKFNISLLIAAAGTAAIYFIRRRRM